MFVSHAWSYPFVDLVAALLARFDNAVGAGSASAPDAAPAAETTLYLWLDVFVGSQHKSETLPAEWWHNAFLQARPAAPTRVGAVPRTRRGAGVV